MEVSGQKRQTRKKKRSAQSHQLPVGSLQVQVKGLLVSISARRRTPPPHGERLALGMLAVYVGPAGSMGTEEPPVVTAYTRLITALTLSDSDTRRSCNGPTEEEPRDTLPGTSQQARPARVHALSSGGPTRSGQWVAKSFSSHMVLALIAVLDG